MRKSEIDSEVLESAKKLYLEGKTIKGISEKTGIHESSVKYYVVKYWKPEKEAYQAELMEVLASEKAADLVEITSYGLTFLKKAMRSLVERAQVDSNPNLLKTISTIVFEINKIKALDEGRSTEIIEHIRPATTGEMIELLKADPFMQIEDAYTVKNSEESDDK